MASFKVKSALAMAIFFWASAFVGIRATMQTYTPEGMALLRYLIAALFIGVIYARLPKKAIKRMRDQCGLLLVGGIGISVYNVMLNYGELSVPSGMTSFIISQSPIMTALLAILFLGERVGLFSVVGFIASLFGVCLITIGERGGLKWDIGIFYIVIATLCGGFFTVLQKPFLKKYLPLEVTTYVIWGGALFLLIYMPNMLHDVAHAPLKATLMVIYLGIFPGVVGYIAWAYVLSNWPVAKAVSGLYFMPLIATLLGWIYLNEVPTMLSVLGGLFILAGVWLVNQTGQQKSAGIRTDAGVGGDAAIG